MPENHGRHKEKPDLAFNQVSAGENYVLPHFESHTSCVCVGERCLVAVTNDTHADSFNTELLKDDSSTQQTVPNATQGLLELNQQESDSEDVSFAHDDIAAHMSHEALDGEEGIVNEMPHGVVSIGRELSLLSGEKSFTKEGDHSRTSHDNCFLRQSAQNSNISMADQEAADIVYDTLRLLNEVLQLESEMTERECSTESSVTEGLAVELTNLEISDKEKYPLQDMHCAKEDSLFATQGISRIRGESASDRNDDISSILHQVPLIFPETSDITISRPTASTANREKSRFPKNTPHLRDVETGVTRDTTTEITQMGLTDNCKGNQSDSSLTDANTRQFHIAVKTHPDGGWGWVVCLGAFLVQFIVLGMQNTAGIVYTELVKKLKSQRGATGWYQF